MNSLIFRATGVSLALSFTMSLSAQSTGNLARKETFIYSGNALTEVSNPDRDILKTMKIENGKVYAHFSKDFSSATEIRFYPVKKNTHITFKVNGDVVRALYSRNGQMMYSVRSYPAEKVRQDLADRVLRAYPCHSIFGVAIQAKVSGKTADLIMIRKNTICKRIRIVGDEMDEYEDFTLPE